MIRFALTEEKNSIMNMWNKMFAFDDGGFTEHYFRYIYKPENCLVKVVDGEIVSSLQRNPHVMMLNGKRISCHLIAGVATDMDYRKRGYMSELMNAVIDELSHKDLVTILQAYDPELYRKYGFEMVYYRNKYEFERNDFPKYSTEGVSKKVDYEQMVRVYKDFTKAFNGYLLRDVDYYKMLDLQVEQENGSIYTYYNGETLDGYMVCYYSSNGLEVDEIIYRNGGALAKLLSYACKQRPSVAVYVSEYENLKKLLPNAKVEKVNNMMVRINDVKLFEECFSINANDVNKAFKHGNKPLFIKEVA